MNIPAKPWNRKYPPRRILCIRTQAMGDVVITLPYIQALRDQLPSSVKIDLLTRKEVDPVPRNIHLFDKVFSLGGGRRYKLILMNVFLFLPRLLLRRYDVVLDLQNNLHSHIVRKTIRPKAWTEFDRFSPVPAGERTRLTIEAAGLGPIQMNNRFRLKNENLGLDILKRNGWNGTDPLIVLNPAGFVESRNWPVQNYVEFARLWLTKFPSAKFIILGVSRVEEKAEVFKKELGDKLINLVNKTTAIEAFAILQHTAFMLSEDSGLMHMSWVSGIPTFALFGIQQTIWPTPLGKHSFSLDHLNNYTAEMIFEHAINLMKRSGYES